VIPIVNQAHHMFQEEKRKEKKRKGENGKDELLGCYLLACPAHPQIGVAMQKASN